MCFGIATQLRLNPGLLKFSISSLSLFFVVEQVAHFVVHFPAFFSLLCWINVVIISSSKFSNSLHSSIFLTLILRFITLNEIIRRITWMPPWGMTGPQVKFSCLSWIIMRPPRMRSPSTSDAFFVGQVKLKGGLKIEAGIRLKTNSGIIIIITIWHFMMEFILLVVVPVKKL